jgi:regulator of RNase E activity RraA
MLPIVSVDATSRGKWYGGDRKLISRTGRTRIQSPGRLFPKHLHPVTTLLPRNGLLPMNAPRILPYSDLLQLKRWNTPTIYNGWEQITKRDYCADAVNLEETRDFMPQMGPMVGYAVTLKVEPSNPTHKKTNPNAWNEYRRYLTSIPAPKIVVVQDLDKPRVIGSFWGEVNANVHRALGCVGTITDGAIRDVDEMTNAGLKAIARRLCVGHAAVQPVEFGCDVEVFGRKISHGDLIHADKHGFLVITPEEQPGILEASRFMDTNECETVIQAARSSAGLSNEEILANLSAAAKQFGQNARDKFKRGGEW